MFSRPWTAAAREIKMCYGALSKGLVALGVELLMAARRLDVENALENPARQGVPGAGPQRSRSDPPARRRKSVKEKIPCG